MSTSHATFWALLALKTKVALITRSFLKCHYGSHLPAKGKENDDDGDDSGRERLRPVSEAKGVVVRERQRV